MNNLTALFENPTAAYRGKPFWAWNGKLEKEELIRQTGVFRDMGFGGYFMHSRTGLVTEYLGDEWFELINACADEGERIGMEAWLYDEDRWPSGTAGGMVTKNPDFRKKYLRMYQISAADFVWSDDIFAAYSARAEGLNLQSYTRLERGTEIPADSLVLYCIPEQMRRSTFYNGYTDVDRMSREATEEFLRLTHEKYKAKCGDRIGKSIPGIFTDEPQRGTLMSPFASEAVDPAWSVPWTEKLPDDFKAHCGYDLLDRLPELFFWFHGEKISEVKWHFTETLQRMFLENYAKPIKNWCALNGFLLTGHILHEDSLSAQTAVSGSMMRYYEEMDYPGVDVLGADNRCYWIVKQLVSAARQFGQKQLLSELYGCTGWQFTFEGHKKTGDWQAFFGINLRCPHLAWYTMAGQGKRDYPASIFYQSAWWREYKTVEDYFSRLSVIMDRGEAVCDVLVLNPVESVWSRIHPGWTGGLDANTPEIQRIDQIYRDVFGWLCGAQLDFDYGDGDILARLGSVEQKNGEALLRVGKAAYRKVLVAGLDTVRSSTLAILREFRKKGGKVIFAGEVPLYVNAVKSGEVLELAGECVTVPLDAGLAKELKPEHQPVSVIGSDGGSVNEIYMQIRKDDDETVILLWNSNPNKAQNGVQVNFNLKGVLTEWDCETGSIRELAVLETRETRLRFDFEGSQWHLLTVTPGASANSPKKTRACEARTREPIAGPFRYTLGEPNVCVLDTASGQIDGEAFFAENILGIDGKARAKFGVPFRFGEMLQPWFTAKTADQILGKIELCFEFFADGSNPGGARLALETPEAYKILLNGQRISQITSEFWVDPCFKIVEIPDGFITKGHNEITLIADFYAGLNLEAVYLLGDFGVSLNGGEKTLTALPKTLETGDISERGLPFYGGKISYHTGLVIAENDRKSVSVQGFAGACVKAVCGGQGRVIGWAPYEADITGFEGELTLELFLTRQNTFEPHSPIPAGLLKTPYLLGE
ncbi:MAG: hypothetical protein LBQ48_00135 [Oscillospiraceae bacterium]|jgi:hypothetical protein|nr:hypothetical protein [Oscillospiraceae bacterium]